MSPPRLLPIAGLSPSTESDNASIRGIVALIWPYSASQKCMSILVAEPDFRLRRSKGQVRVTFRGASAKEIARLDVTIGDEVDFELGGAQWEEEDSSAFTPGKGIEWRMVFRKQLRMQVGAHW